MGCAFPGRVIWLTFGGGEVELVQAEVAARWLRVSSYWYLTLVPYLMQYSFLLSLQALLHLPLAYAALLVVADAAFNALMPDVRPASALQGCSLASWQTVHATMSPGTAGVLHLLCLYNVWLQQRQERLRLANLVKAITLRTQIQAVASRLLRPPRRQGPLATRRHHSSRRCPRAARTCAFLPAPPAASRCLPAAAAPRAPRHCLPPTRVPPAARARGVGPVGRGEDEGDGRGGEGDGFCGKSAACAC